MGGKRGMPVLGHCDLWGSYHAQVFKRLHGGCGRGKGGGQQPVRLIERGLQKRRSSPGCLPLRRAKQQTMGIAQQPHADGLVRGAVRVVSHQCQLGSAVSCK